MATPLVSLHLHRVTPAALPAVLWRVAVDRAALRTTTGVRFAKLLGTGDGRTFDVRDADPGLWGVLAVWDSAADLAAFELRSPIAASWRRLAVESWRADLEPVASRGRWSGCEPFGHPSATATTGAVAAITRARLRWGRTRSFRRAVPPVSAELSAQPGLLLALGIGEAPIGLQGTFSVWRDADALRAFAYRGAAHREVIRRTAPERWYAEELFARFRVLQTTGSLWGADPLAAAPGPRQ